MNIKGKNIIVVVGLPASGKSTLSHQLVKENPEYSLYQTDDYIHYGFTESLYVLLGDIYMKDKIIVEGVQAYRLLIHGVKEKEFYPDMIIHCNASTPDRVYRYYQRGEKLPNAQFENQIRSWWFQYTAMENPSKPVIVEHETSTPSYERN